MGHKLLVIFVSLSITSSLLGQQKPTPPAKKSAAVAAKSEHADPTTADLPSEDEVNGFMQQTFGYDPQLTWKLAGIQPSSVPGLAEVNVLISGPQGQGAQKFFVSSDGKHAVVGEIIPFGKHPFEQARQQLRSKANGPTRGPANAPVTVVEFSDLQCPHCKEANPTIERLLNEDHNVHFIFQSFPLPSHNWAEKAAAYADCVARSSNDTFWKYIDSVYEAQADITAENADQKLTELADKAGVKGTDIASCAATPEAAARVEASLTLGKSLDVNSTPTLFVNGRPIGIGANNYDVLKQVVDFAAQQN